MQKTKTNRLARAVLMGVSFSDKTRIRFRGRLKNNLNLLVSFDISSSPGPHLGHISVTLLNGSAGLHEENSPKQEHHTRQPESITALRISALCPKNSTGQKVRFYCPLPDRLFGFSLATEAFVRFGQHRRAPTTRRNYIADRQHHAGNRFGRNEPE